MNCCKELYNDKEFLSKVFKIAIPVAFQSMLNMVINLVDMIMIGKLGASSIAALGLANKVFFVYNLLIFGIASATGIFASQYWGAKDIKSIKKIIGLTLTIAITSGLCFVLAEVMFPQYIMQIFTPDENVINIGAKYLMIVCFSYPFVAVTNIMNAILRAMELVKIPVKVSIFTIILNVTLNYILIFGWYSIPALGVVGAAIATVISRIFEIVLLIIILKVLKNPIMFNIKEWFDFNRTFTAMFFKTSFPVIANEFMWGLGTTLYSVIYGHMGLTAVTSMTITESYQEVLNVLFFGLASAALVILGHEMGAGNLQRAKKYGKYFYILSFLIGLLTTVISLTLSNAYISFYNVDANLHQNIKMCILSLSVFLPALTVSTTNIIGILRSGGDTRACFIIDVSGVWCIGLPLAYIGGIILKLPVYWVFTLVNSAEIFKVILGYIRYKKYKWLKNLVI